jgi:hypothetical protein
MGTKSSERREQDGVTIGQEFSTLIANLSSNVNVTSPSSQSPMDSTWSFNDAQKPTATGNHNIGSNTFSFSMPPPATFRLGDWMCPVAGCGAHNFGRNMNCIGCGSARGTTVSPFSFPSFSTNQPVGNPTGSANPLSGLYGANLNPGNFAMGMGMFNRDSIALGLAAKRSAAQEHLQQQNRFNGGAPLIPRLAALNFNGKNHSAIHLSPRLTVLMLTLLLLQRLLRKAPVLLMGWECITRVCRLWAV